jgi:hypothetical protein
LDEELAIRNNPQTGDQVIFSQVSLPLAFDEPTPNCKAAVAYTLDSGLYRVLSAGLAEPRFFTRLLLLHLTLFQPGLENAYTGLDFIFILINTLKFYAAFSSDVYMIKESVFLMMGF